MITHAVINGITIYPTVSSHVPDNCESHIVLTLPEGTQKDDIVRAYDGDKLVKEIVVLGPGDYSFFQFKPLPEVK